MLFRQFYLGCLAHASYLIGSNGEAAVVDPQRDVDQYIAEAQANGLRIRYVIETHLHADFVSGHRELAARTGATIVIGREAHADFPHLAAGDGLRLDLGDVVFGILETPGHTPESICITIAERSAPDRPRKVLTGDTLFIGDVGRPDLATGAGFTAQQMAAMMFDSLHGKLLRLADDVEVYPAHGAGSLCGKNISKETSSTIGMQRRTNYALAPMSKDEFVAMMTRDVPEAPQHFARDAEINRRGARGLSEIARPHPVPPPEVNGRFTVLDVRNPNEFGAGHVPRSVNIGLNGQYASWAGALLSPEDELLIVGDGERQVEEAVMRLSRVGLENARAFLAGGVEAWFRAGQPVREIAQVSVGELASMIASAGGLQVIDVRRPGEYRDGHVPEALSVPLSDLPSRAGELDAGRPTAVICAGGYRSSIATSLLERAGFEELYNVTGGTAAWVAAGLPIRTSDR